MGTKENSDLTDWSGAPIVLDGNVTTNMQQTPNGSMIFAYQNLTKENSKGALLLSTGGNDPIKLEALPLTGAPEWEHQNWGGDNLEVSNVSYPAVPIRIQAVGPGIDGIKTKKITIGKELKLDPGECAEAELKPTTMQFVFSTIYTATFGLIGGTPIDGRNAYTFTVKAQTNSAPPAGAQAVPGDYSTTADHYDFPVNWGSSSIFIANLSGSTSEGNKVLINIL